MPRARTISKLALLVFAVLALLPVAATARRIAGTARADRVVATERADVIRVGRGADSVRGRGGADRIHGGAGRDRLYGGSGNDRLFGGPGKDRLVGATGSDRLVGGAGNDVLDAVDGSRDARVDGGGGENLCLLDALDLARAVGCGAIRIKNQAPPGSPSLPGSGGSTGGAPGGGAGPAVLTVTSASGVSCVTVLPACSNSFQLSGTGARANPTVSGTGGVIAAAIGTAAADGSWNATGAYSCSSSGSLIVSDGVQQATVPVSCSAGP